MKGKDGGQAFPSTATQRMSGDHNDVSVHSGPSGMSLLDYFAGCEQKRNPCARCASQDCGVADRAGCFYEGGAAMLAEREKRSKS